METAIERTPSPSAPPPKPEQPGPGLPFGWVEMEPEVREEFVRTEARRDVARLSALLPVLLGVHLVDLIAFGSREVAASAAEQRWELLTIRSHAVMAVVAAVLWALAWRFRGAPSADGRRDRHFVSVVAGTYVGFAGWLGGVDQLVTTAITPFAIAQLFAAVLLTLPSLAAAVVHVGACAVLASTLELFYSDPSMALANTVNGLSVTLVAWGVGRIVAGSRARAFADRRRIEAQQAELAAVNEQLHRLATHDTLTGLANRRWLMEQAEQLASLTHRQGRPLHVLLVDVDHFKSVNDEHGHAVGDEVLRQLARTFEQVLRKSDVAGRLGGEEFAIIAPDTHQDGARQLAERLRKAVEQAGPVLPGMGPVTVSVGVATVVGQGHTAVADAFQQADDALYAAKRGGRNRVSTPPLRAAQAG